MRGSSFDPYSVFIYYQYISDKNSLGVLPSFACYTPSHIIVPKVHGLSLESNQSVYSQKEGNSSPWHCIRGIPQISPLKLWLRAIFYCRVFYTYTFLSSLRKLQLTYIFFSFLLFLYNFLLHFSPSNHFIYSPYSLSTLWLLYY